MGSQRVRHNLATEQRFLLTGKFSELGKCILIMITCSVTLMVLTPFIATFFISLWEAPGADPAGVEKEWNQCPQQAMGV